MSSRSIGRLPRRYFCSLDKPARMKKPWKLDLQMLHLTSNPHSTMRHSYLRRYIYILYDKSQLLPRPLPHSVNRTAITAFQDSLRGMTRPKQPPKAIEARNALLDLMARVSTTTGVKIEYSSHSSLHESTSQAVNKHLFD